MAERQKIALSWALFMAVPVRATPEEWAKPATANINLALAHHLTLGAVALAPAQVLINTPAPARGTPVAPALPVVENIINVTVQVIIVGMVAVVLFLVHQVINIHAPVPAMQVAQAMLAVVSMRLVPAPLATNGKMEAARNKSSTAPKVSCIIAMAKLLVYVLRVWASMLR